MLDCMLGFDRNLLLAKVEPPPFSRSDVVALEDDDKEADDGGGKAAGTAVEAVEVVAVRTEDAGIGDKDKRLMPFTYFDFSASATLLVEEALFSRIESLRFVSSARMLLILALAEEGAEEE